MAAAEEAYYAVLKEMGMESEYANFPDVESCRRGPFNPSADD
jgi:hypothetical protein